MFTAQEARKISAEHQERIQSDAHDKAMKIVDQICDLIREAATTGETKLMLSNSVGDFPDYRPRFYPDLIENGLPTIVGEKVKTALHDLGYNISIDVHSCVRVSWGDELFAGLPNLSNGR